MSSTSSAVEEAKEAERKQLEKVIQEQQLTKPPAKKISWIYRLEYLYFSKLRPDDAYCVKCPMWVSGACKYSTNAKQHYHNHHKELYNAMKQQYEPEKGEESDTASLGSASTASGKPPATVQTKLQQTWKGDRLFRAHDPQRCVCNPAGGNQRAAEQS